MYLYLTTLALLLGLSVSAASLCPPTGPVLPFPRISPNESGHGLTQRLDEFVRGAKVAGWNTSVNSFSVIATSADATFFDYHYTAPVKNESGVLHVDGNTVYSAASITKVFTVLAVWLDERMNLDDPIGNYVQELNSSEWGDVTLRLLTSQIAAVPRNGYTFDNAPQAVELAGLGFPELSPGEMPPCSLAPGLRMCSREEFFSSFSEFGFTGQVGDRVAYSDLAYILLGYALEDITGLPYSQVLKESILDVVGLSDTGFDSVEASRMIIPSEAAFWIDIDWAYYVKTAGLYSTPNDLSAFARAIYNNTLLSRARTNEWLKPSAFTSQLDNSVGAPWEIFRPTTLTKDGRPVDHYTKSGDLPGFSSSYLVLVPEFELGVTILSAGPDASTLVPLLLDTVQAALIPFLDQLARVQAVEMYAGTYYESQAGNKSAEISLEVDDGPGLKVTSWKKGRIDMLKSFDVVLFGADAEEALPVDVRFYPIGEDERWYAGFSEADTKIQQGAGPLRGSACMPWYRVDQFHYGRVRLDEVAFRRNEDGGIEGLEVPGLRGSFDKVKV